MKSASMFKVLRNSTALMACLGIVVGGGFAVAQGTLPAPEGFVLTLDGETFEADAAVEKRVKKVEVKIAAADVQISYNGADPIADLGLVVAPSGSQFTFTSTANYPAFIARGEIRLFDAGATGGPRLLAVAPLMPNAQLTLPRPDAVNPVVVYRVYDARGRFDETEAMPLGIDGPATASGEPARSGIRVRGGAVLISASNIAAGARLEALGESIQPGQFGSVELERILPSGLHEVDVAITGGPTQLSFGRDIEIDAADWFYVVVADATIWGRRNGETGKSYTENNARLQFYVSGETEGGIQVDASLDTGEGDIRDIFRHLDEKDPRAVAARLMSNDAHVTYGDDSTAEDLTPTSGRIYLRVASDESYMVWGDYQAQIDGSDYLRNTRNLYGAQVHFEGGETTGRGEARVSVDAFAAQPDQLMARDVFQGTGGSIYFLSRQDISAGTEVVSVVFTDKVTGRVIERRTLEVGTDYALNAMQGVVTLSAPLDGSTDGGLITTSGGDTTVSLEVQYEYTPIGIDGGGLTAGMRAEAWVTDDLRVGGTYTYDDSGTADQQAVGVDLRYLIGDNSYVHLEYAQSSGPGYDSLYSVDGGLILDTRSGGAGSGAAAKVEAKFDFADFNEDLSGSVGGYAEARQAGFNTLDYQTAESQKLYGVYLEQSLANGLSYGLRADMVDNATSADTTRVGADVTWTISDVTSLTVAAENLQEKSAGATSNRLDVAARLSRKVGNDGSVYVYGQKTVSNAGLDTNDRVGVGASQTFENGFTAAADVSKGTTGWAASTRISYATEDGSSTYFGYELDPSLTYGTGISPRNAGQFVVGGTGRINDSTTLVAENRYNMLGDRRETNTSVGLDIAVSEALTFGGRYAQGRVDDPVNGDLTRDAMSFSAAFADDKLTANARVEYRRDRELESSGREDTDTIAIGADAMWRLDDDQRLVFNLASSRTLAETGSLLAGSFTEATFGYAYRPTEGGRVNALASYRYVYDTFGQTVDGVAGTGPIQESHILNAEGNYDLSTDWTIGAKLGYRSSRSADKGAAMAKNDAMLAVANARYHLLKDWDALLELRHFTAIDAEFSETGALAAAYKQLNQNVTVGVGYNFTTFSDDLADLTFDDEGAFLNIVAAF